MNLRARDFAGPAWRFLRSEAPSLARLGAPAVLVMLAGGWLPGLAGADYRVVVSLSSLVAAVVMLQFARVVYGGLAAGLPPRPADLLRIDGLTWSIAWRSVAMGILVGLPAGIAVVVAFVVSLGAAFGSSSSSGIEWLIWIIVLPALWLSLWLALRLVPVPILAVAPALRLAPVGPFGTAWALSRGRTWLLFKLLFLTVAPFALPAALLPWSFRLGGAFSLATALAVGVLITALQLAIIAISGHALVALTRALRAAVAAAPRSAPAAPPASP